LHSNFISQFRYLLSSSRLELSPHIWSAAVAVDLNWELTILEIVQGFYLNLLREFLEDEVTPPSGLEAASLRSRDRNVSELLPAMRRWLKLLDMAITPDMLRHSLTTTIDQDLAEALLRYYARKQSKNDFDRDKTDFVATFLYRNPRVPGQWDKRGLSMDGVAPVPPFEIALMEILDDAELPHLTPEESRMLDEFEYLGEEVEQIQQFDRLIDSGLMQKARTIKHTFGSAFYHPHALAAIAPYNYKFGRRFSELFADAAVRIKSYAQDIQQRGGSLSSRVDGDVTVQHLTQVEEQTILKTEYRRAQDHFRHFSRLKKAVDSRSHSNPGDMSRPSPRPAARVAHAPTSAPAAPPTAAALSATTPLHTFTDHGQLQEETRIRSVEDSLRSWVRAADERYRQVVPMKFGNFVLQPHEADACSAEFHQEKSFRGDNARSLIRLVAVMARMQAEIEEFRLRQDSTHLWRPHADALAILVEAASSANQNALSTLKVATDRGLMEKAKLLTATIDRLRNRVEQVHQTLALANGRLETSRA